MHSEIHEVSPILIEVKIEIPWDRVRKDLDDNFRKMGRSARVKGFRPGKVPPKVIRQLFGRQVKGEVTASLVEAGLMHAVTEHELQIVAQPEFDAPIIEDGQPLKFEAKVEVRPKVEHVDTTKLALSRKTSEVPNAQVDQEVERLQNEHAEVREPDPMRASEAGDQLVIDYTVTIDGEDRPEMGANDRPVDLGRDQLIEEFEKGLIGLSPNEEGTITVEFPEDHDNEDLRSKSAVFSVKVTSLKEKLLPELDDEFAKDVGEYETLLELRLKLREKLEDLAKRRSESELKEQLVDKLVETNDVPVPPSMIQQEQSRMMYEFAAFMQMTGQQPQLGDDWQEGMSERAERKVKAAILLGAVAREQGIEIGEADVEARLAEMAEESGKHIAKVRVEYQGEKRDTLESQILEEKLMDYLMKQATITDAPADEPDAEPAEAKSESEPKKKAVEKKAVEKKVVEKKAVEKKAVEKKAVAEESE